MRVEDDAATKSAVCRDIPMSIGRLIPKGVHRARTVTIGEANIATEKFSELMKAKSMGVALGKMLFSR
jgi:carbamoylphosphate synthase large subunit